MPCATTLVLTTVRLSGGSVSRGGIVPATASNPTTMSCRRAAQSDAVLMGVVHPPLPSGPCERSVWSVHTGIFTLRVVLPLSSLESNDGDDDDDDAADDDNEGTTAAAAMTLTRTHCVSSREVCDSEAGQSGECTQ
jgi:hypothetical protein